MRASGSPETIRVTMMRILVVILLLLLSVACDSAAPTVDLGFDLAVASPTNTIGDDLTEQDATPTVAQATVMGPVPRGEERGEVIDGFCPDEVEPATFRTRYHPEQSDVWELRATAHHGRIVLEWDDPPYQGVTGYVVTRHSRIPNSDFYGPGWPTRMEEGSVRTFTVVESPGKRQWIDTTDIEPSTQYRYRVFPVTHNHFWFPSKPLDISSRPAERPSAPLMVGASFPDGSWNTGTDSTDVGYFLDILSSGTAPYLIHANHTYGSPVHGMRVLRREIQRGRVADRPRQYQRPRFGYHRGRVKSLDRRRS